MRPTYFSFQRNVEVILEGKLLEEKTLEVVTVVESNQKSRFPILSVVVFPIWLSDFLAILNLLNKKTSS